MPPDWTVRSRNGRAVVHGCRSLMGGRMRDRLWWTDESGRQRHTSLAVHEHDPERAKRHAEKIANAVAANAGGPALRKGEAREFLAARDALSETGLPVDVAAREYAAARKLAESAGGTVLAAVEEFAARRAAKSRPVRDVVADLCRRLEKRGRSAGYVADLRRWGNALADSFPGPISAIVARDLESWLIERSTTAKTFNNQRAGLGTIFQFAVKEGWARDNPALAIPRATERRSIQCYSAAEMAAILAGLDPHLVPFVALQAFGCLRALEVTRAEWVRHVNLEAGVIRVSDAIAKTDRPRIIEMPENLREWLTPWTLARGPIYPHRSADLIEYKRLRRVFLADCERRGVAAAIDNGLRKTCASHLVPVCAHIGAAAEMMGHTVSQLKRNYRELVTREDARRYWSIVPSNVKRLAKAG